MARYDVVLSHVMWSTVVVIVVVSYAVAMWMKPSWFLHPRLTWHRLVLKHAQELVPAGWADWDIQCSCGIKGEL